MMLKITFIKDASTVWMVWLTWDWELGTRASISFSFALHIYFQPSV